MFRFTWTLSVRTRDFLRRYMPSNRLVASIRTRRGLKWGVPAMLVAAPYILVATICSDLAADGGPGWLHLVVLWGCCYADSRVMPIQRWVAGVGRLGRHFLG